MDFFGKCQKKRVFLEKSGQKVKKAIFLPKNDLLV
jgi:hypothetical protein